MFLFFDTETTGLPKNWKSDMRDVDNWPRVIQLAWMVTDASGVIMKEEKYLIKPDGWVIPNEKFWIENGFTQSESEIFGHPLSGVLDKFIIDLQYCKYMIAHNMSFDYNVLGSELIRGQKNSKNKPQRICTMQSSIDFCNLPRKKFPKLIELYTLLFGKGFDGAHDAMNDVVACKECFFALIGRGVIQLDDLFIYQKTNP